MSHYSRALNSILWQHRKRKQVSLDGTVAGLSPNHYVPGLGASLGQHSSHATSPGPMTFYDLRTQYDWPEQDYAAPEPWFEGTFQATPPLRIEGSPGHGEQKQMPVTYDDALMTDELMQLATQAFLEQDQEAPIAFLDSLADQQMPLAGAAQLDAGLNAWAPESPMDFSEDEFQQMEGSSPGPFPEAEPMGEVAEATVGSQLDPFAGPELAAEPVDPMAGFDIGQPDQGGLEALVEQAAIEQPDPFELQQLYEDEMEQLQNAFMMPGPFGPMPGP